MWPATVKVSQSSTSARIRRCTVWHVKRGNSICYNEKSQVFTLEVFDVFTLKHCCVLFQDLLMRVVSVVWMRSSVKRATDEPVFNRFPHTAWHLKQPDSPDIKPLDNKHRGGAIQCHTDIVWFIFSPVSRSHLYLIFLSALSLLLLSNATNHQAVDYPWAASPGGFFFFFFTQLF